VTHGGVIEMARGRRGKRGELRREVSRKDQGVGEKREERRGGGGEGGR